MASATQRAERTGQRARGEQARALGLGGRRRETRRRRGRRPARPRSGRRPSTGRGTPRTRSGRFRRPSPRRFRLRLRRRRWRSVGTGLRLRRETISAIVAGFKARVGFIGILRIVRDRGRRSIDATRRRGLYPLRKMLLHPQRAGVNSLVHGWRRAAARRSWADRRAGGLGPSTRWHARRRR